jgi:hypothetical protein
MVAKTGKLPVPNFSAGGIATPADAALMMQLGAETVFVGSGIFMKERATPLDVENDQQRARRSRLPRQVAIVLATTHFDNPKILAEASEQVTGTMKGLAAAAIEPKQDLLQTRGWCGSAPPVNRHHSRLYRSLSCLYRRLPCLSVGSRVISTALHAVPLKTRPQDSRWPQCRCRHKYW